MSTTSCPVLLLLLVAGCAPARDDTAVARAAARLETPDASDASDDATPEPLTLEDDDAGTIDAVSAEALPEPDFDLRNLQAFRLASTRWKQELEHDSPPGHVPQPPLISSTDPAAPDLQQAYLDALEQRPFTQHLYPFGRSSQAAGSGIPDATSLILAGDRAGALRLTDFSLHSGEPRIAAACDHYLARARQTRGEDPADGAKPYRESCATLGTVVATSMVADLQVHGAQLFRGDDCALPSAVYGAYTPDDDGDGTWHYAWPDFSKRRRAVRQPCLGLLLDVEARDEHAAELGRGLLFVKATADHERVPFPYGERDPVHGRERSANGAPRGEFVSTRWLFDDGAALYTGLTPVWVLPISLLNYEWLPRLQEVLDGDAPTCTSALVAAARPCIADPQPPFVFANDGAALWARQLLNGADPRYEADPLATIRQRNPFELEQVSRRDSPHGAMLDILDFFNATLSSARTAAQRSADAEQLSAMWHSLQVYRAPFSGFERTDRKRAALVLLDARTMLVIPDQGYFQLGKLTPEAVASLPSDPAELWKRLHATVGDEAFRFGSLFHL